MTLNCNGQILQDKVPHRNQSKLLLPNNAKYPFENPNSVPTGGKGVSNARSNNPPLPWKIQAIPSNTLKYQLPLQLWMRPPTVIPTVKKAVTFARTTAISDLEAAKNVRDQIPIKFPTSLKSPRHNVTTFDKQTKSTVIKDLAKYGHLSKVHFHNGNAWNYSLFEDGVGLERFNIKPSFYSLVTQPNLSMNDNCLQWIKARRYDYAKSNSRRNSDGADNTLTSTTGKSNFNTNEVQSNKTPRRVKVPSLSLFTDDGAISSDESDSVIIDCTIDEEDGNIGSKRDVVSSSNIYRGPFKRCRYDYSLRGDQLYEVKPCYIPPSIGKPTLPATKGKAKLQGTKKHTSTADVEDINYKTTFAKRVNAIFGSHPTRRDIKKDVLVRPVPGISAKRIYGAGVQDCDGVEIGEFCNSITAAINGPPRRPRSNCGPKPKEGNDGNRSKWDPMRIRMCGQHRACRSSTTKLGHKPTYLFYGSLKLSCEEKKGKHNCGPLVAPLKGVFVITGGEYSKATIETFERSYKPEIELLFERGKPAEPWEVKEWQKACGLTRRQLLIHKRASDRSDKINVGWFGERKVPCVSKSSPYPQNFHVLDPTEDVVEVLENFDERTTRSHAKRAAKRNMPFGSSSKSLSQWLMTIKDDEPDQQLQDEELGQSESKQESGSDGPMFRIFDNPCANYPGDFLARIDHSEMCKGLHYDIYDVASVGLRKQTRKGACNGNDIPQYWQSKFLLMGDDDNDFNGNGNIHALDANGSVNSSDDELKNIERFQKFASHPMCDSAGYLGAKDIRDAPISLLDGAPTGVAAEACEDGGKNVTSKNEVSGAQRAFALKVLLRFPYLDLRCFC